MTLKTTGGVRIKTLNVGKRRTAIDSLLCDEAIARYDVLCLQELPVGLGARVLERAGAHWFPLFPSLYDRNSRSQSVRSAILIRTHFPSSTYAQIPIISLDITAVAFTLNDVSFSLCLGHRVKDCSTTGSETVDGL